MTESALDAHALDARASLHDAKNIPNSLFLHRMTRATGYGATEARLTPDQKAGTTDNYGQLTANLRLGNRNEQTTTNLRLPYG